MPLALLLLLAACGPRADEARLLLEDIAGGGAPSVLTRTTPAPIRQDAVWRVEGRDGAGDLYLSPEGPLARLVLVPGLTPEGPRDRRLVVLAEALARARFAVLVPDLPNLRRLTVDPSDARAIADAVVAFGGLPAPGAPAHAVGLAAVSYAVGPALLAALEPDAAAKTQFIVAIGGYYDMAAVLTYLTTGRYRAGAGQPWQEGQPRGLAKWLFVAVNAERLDDLADRALFAAIGRRRQVDPAAPVSDLAARLGPQGRALLALLENEDPDAVPALIAALPPDLRDTFAALSPSHRDLRALRARLILVHGRDDPAVPFTESFALAAAVGPGQARLFLIDGLDHVDFRADLGFSDRLVLLEAAKAVLAERDWISSRLPAGAR
ncbi:MAG: alpha/beta hydrolase [Inquilinus sp.]|nr:alpha/beta hydrolase [Inquilinus sp.]